VVNPFQCFCTGFAVVLKWVGARFLGARGGGGPVSVLAGCCFTEKADRGPMHHKCLQKNVLLAAADMACIVFCVSTSFPLLLCT
jgi:hypothetical protein